MSFLRQSFLRQFVKKNLNFTFSYYKRWTTQLLVKKTEIAAIIKKFKEILELYSDKATERHLMLSN